jgi:hypothetical protein
MEWWTRFDEIYSNEGVHVKSIVSLNLFDPLILTNAKMPSYVCNDATTTISPLPAGLVPTKSR